MTAPAPAHGAPRVFEEAICEGFRYSVDGVVVERQRSPWQLIEIIDTPAFGRALRIDGALQCSERDEQHYHEPIVHAALTRAAARGRVLIVGGGDGGAAEEVLKWPDVAHVEQVEIDEVVLRLSARHLASIHHGLIPADLQAASPDDRFVLRVGDGMARMAAAAREPDKFDVVILDLTDPGGASEPLWSAAFFALCAQALKPHGALTLHIGAPWAQASRCAEVLRQLRASFEVVEPLAVTVPLSGGQWLMAVCQPRAGGPARTVQDVDALLARLRGQPLKVVDGALLRAMAVLPVGWRRW